MIYAVPTVSLHEYSQDNRKYTFQSLPDDKYRLRDMEIEGKEQPLEEDSLLYADNQFMVVLNTDEQIDDYLESIYG